MLSTWTTATLIHLVLASPPARQAPAAPRPAPRRLTAPPAHRLAAWITKINPRASSWAPTLAARIMLEAKRHSVPPRALAAIAWIESDFRRNLRGRFGELGIWQLLDSDSHLARGWDFVRRRPGEFPIAAKVGTASSWRRLPRARRDLLRLDLVSYTYLAALEISEARWLCYRMRNKPHRYGRRWIQRSYWYAHQRPGYRLDPFAHYNSGTRPPRPVYVRKLRRRACLIGAYLDGARRDCPRESPRLLPRPL